MKGDIVMMQDEVQPQYIPPGGYTSATRGNSAQYASRIGVNQTLKEWMDKLQVTKYQLGRILGTAQPSQIYKWTTGKNRPNPMYLTRLLKVVHMFTEGIAIKKISYIDWETSVIKWRDGDVTYTDHLFGDRGPVSETKYRSRREMAVIPHQPARPDGPHN